MTAILGDRPAARGVTRSSRIPAAAGSSSAASARRRTTRPCPPAASESSARCTVRWLAPSASASAELDHDSPSASSASTAPCSLLDRAAPAPPPRARDAAPARTRARSRARRPAGAAPGAAARSRPAGARDATRWRSFTPNARATSASRGASAGQASASARASANSTGRRASDTAARPCADDVPAGVDDEGLRREQRLDLGEQQRSLAPRAISRAAGVAQDRAGAFDLGGQRRDAARGQPLPSRAPALPRRAAVVAAAGSRCRRPPARERSASAGGRRRGSSARERPLGLVEPADEQQPPDLQMPGVRGVHADRRARRAARAPPPAPSAASRGRARPARSPPRRRRSAPAPPPLAARSARAARRSSSLARAKSPSCAMAIPRSASAGGSSRSATRFSAPSGSPAASARAAAVISESTETRHSCNSGCGGTDWLYIQPVTSKELAGEIARDCLATRVRRLERTVSRIYDGALRGTGVTAPQLALLVTVELAGPTSAAFVAERLDLEKSTVSRNLARLANAGLLTTDGGLRITAGAPRRFERVTRSGGRPSGSCARRWSRTSCGWSAPSKVPNHKGVVMEAVALSPTVRSGRATALATTLSVLIAWFLLSVWVGLAGALGGPGKPPLGLAIALVAPLALFALDGRLGGPLFEGMRRLDLSTLIAARPTASAGCSSWSPGGPARCRARSPGPPGWGTSRWPPPPRSSPPRWPAAVAVTGSCRWPGTWSVWRTWWTPFSRASPTPAIIVRRAGGQPDHGRRDPLSAEPDPHLLRPAGDHVHLLLAHARGRGRAGRAVAHCVSDRSGG